MNDYENALQHRVAERLETFRQRRLEEKRTALLAPPRRPSNQAQRAEVEALNDPFKSVVNLYDSDSGDGQDVEVRLTMPIDEFTDFAPIAALEAASTPHEFPVVYIFVRHETTDRVARVAFKDAEPIAGRYRAGDENAIEEMKEALIWH